MASPWHTDVERDTYGHYHATVIDPANMATRETCTHNHGTQDAADACAGWEARARAKGQSRWHAQKGATTTPRTRKAALNFNALRVASAEDAERASDDEAAHSHEYVPNPKLVQLWHALVTGAQDRPAANVLFIGPSGSGKTDGARYLAALVGLPFTKVDAASMTDPEAWFGTREIVVQDGVAITDYRPSSFVQALGEAGVLLIDEMNRTRDSDRNVLIPVLDHTRAVMNPLTGEVVRRHPQCFIIMSGNVGLQFTGTNAIDPAFISRSLTVKFDYIDSDAETRVVVEASGADEDDAAVFVRFANETRAKAKNDPEFNPISTREVIEAARLTKDGLSRDLAIEFAVLNAASDEGGSASVRQELQNLWNGVRNWRPERKAADAAGVAGQRSSWVCPVHQQVKVVPAGVSTKTGKPYSSFKACPVPNCGHTEDRDNAAATATVPGAGKTCASCGSVNPVGRNSFCVQCGATL